MFFLLLINPNLVLVAIYRVQWHMQSQNPDTEIQLATLRQI